MEFSPSKSLSLGIEIELQLVRAHDRDLAHEAGDLIERLARIERLAFVGAYVKVTLRLPDDASLTVELGKSEFEALAVAAGDRVLADVEQAKIFVGDYAI